MTATRLNAAVVLVLVNPHNLSFLHCKEDDVQRISLPMYGGVKAAEDVESSLLGNKRTVSIKTIENEIVTALGQVQLVGNEKAVVGQSLLVSWLGILA